MNDVLKYNLINESNIKILKYNLSNTKLSVEFLLNSKKELIIIGRLDNNYICWLSRTNINDKKINSEIFNYLASEKLETISTIYSVLEDDYYKIEEYFKAKLTRNDKADRWNTPFGHCYGAGNKDEHGRFFAGDIITYFDKLQNKCRIRSLDGIYTKILEKYYSIMSKDNDPFYYCKMTELIEIIEDEKYILLAEDDNLRKAYIDCLKMSTSLYNRYMTVVR